MFGLFSNLYKKIIESWRQRRNRRELTEMRAKGIDDLIDKIQRSHNIEIVKSHDTTKKLN